MPLINTHRDGRALDETSDLIDDVNVLKPQINAIAAAASRALSQLSASRHGDDDAHPDSSSRLLGLPPTFSSPSSKPSDLLTVGSNFTTTPDVTPISSNTPSEVDPTESQDHVFSSDTEDEADLLPTSSSCSVKTSDEEEEAAAVMAGPAIIVSNESEALEAPPKEEKVFRDYANACERVRNFYAEQHKKQTMEYNIKAREHFHTREKVKMGVWEAIEWMNTLVDESDPDTSLSQIEHLLQTAEAIRRDGKPDWMQLVGLIHDLGKLLFFLGAEGQWDVVGDTFVVGCAFSDKNIYPETFAANPDAKHPVYSTKNGIYEEGCGMENIMVSWGHDEYMYLVAKKFSTIPEEGLAMIRFHSFYPWHRENAYSQFMKAGDDKLLKAVREFNPYDLYTKADEPVDVDSVKSYYQGLIRKYFADVVEW